jgi:hypothetical protein
MSLACQKFARNYATRNRTIATQLTQHLGSTCAVVWSREVSHGVVNRPRIDGKDGVAGSIPAGGSTEALTSANASQFHVWERWADPIRIGMCCWSQGIWLQSVGVSTSRFADLVCREFASAAFAWRWYST